MDQEKPKADARGIPILDEVVTSDELEPAYRLHRAGLPPEELLPSLSLTEARLIIEQLGPEIDLIIEQTLSRNIRDAVHKAVAASKAPIQEKLLRLLKRIIRGRYQAYAHTQELIAKKEK
jgi:hypothetical protein